MEITLKFEFSNIVSGSYDLIWDWSDSTGHSRLSDKFCQTECQGSRSVSRSDLQNRCAEGTELRIA
jgi:hypothetical protein